MFRLKHIGKPFFYSHNFSNAFFMRYFEHPDMVGNLQELLSMKQHLSEKCHLRFFVPKDMARNFSVIESLKLTNCEKQIQVFLQCMLVSTANAHSLGFCKERTETMEISNGFENS